MSEPNPPSDAAATEALSVLAALSAAAQTLDTTLGVELTDATAEMVTAVVEIDDRHRQPLGLVHGGLYAVVAESTASIGAAITAIPAGGSAVGLSNNTSFVRPIVGDGRLTSTARRIHAGRTTQLWDVEHVGPEGKLCATSRVTIALRYPEPAAATASR